MILNNNEIHKTHDNVELYITRNIVEDAKAIVLIVHGLAEHSGRYDYVVSNLNSYKYSVYRFDNRGHGKSTGKRIFIEDYNKFSEDIEEIVNLIKNENQGKPVFILGHSMGGMISTVYGINYKNKVDGIILSAAVTYDEAMLMYDNKNLDPNQMVDNGLSHLICKNQQVVDDYNNDPLVAHEISGSMFIECSKAVEYIKENVKDLEYPILILHGLEDKIVYPTDSKLLFDNIGSKYKKIKLYENMYHEILNEDKKDDVLNDINNWIRKELRYIK